MLPITFGAIYDAPSWSLCTLDIFHTELGPLKNVVENLIRYRLLYLVFQPISSEKISITRKPATGIFGVPPTRLFFSQ